MDKITIADLEVFFYVGVPEEERTQPQRLLLTVELSIDFHTAATRDDLTATIDYQAVTQRLLQFGEGKSWKLIEKIASDVAQMLFADFPAQTVRVEVKKFVIPEARYVSATVERFRS